MIADGWLVFDGVGTAGEWISGIGTIAAIAFAYWIERRSQRQRRDDDLARARRDARLLVLRDTDPASNPDDPTTRRYIYKLHNRHHLAFRNVDVTVLVGAKHKLVERFALLEPEDRPQKVGYVGPLDAAPRWFVEYSDHEGYRWRQDANGVIERIVPKRGSESIAGALAGDEVAK